MTEASVLLQEENSITLIKGVNRTLEVVVTDLDHEIVNLTGGRLILSVKEQIDDEFPLIQKDTQQVAQGLITSPLEGKAQFFLLPADTVNLRTNFEYLYDIWLITSTGDRHVIVEPSAFYVKDSITRIPL